MKPWSNKFCRISALCLGLLGTIGTSQAQEVYGGAGLFGAQLGYAHAINNNFTVRLDYLGLGSRKTTETESGTTYDATLSLKRTGVFADYFPWGGGFRLTGGLTSNNIGFDLNASGAGSTIDINGTPHTLGAGDSMNVKIKLPKTTPYVGIGYGHQKSDKGFGFHADFGVMLGSFKVSERRSGALANGGAAGVTQADVDAELTDIRDSMSTLKVFPQITLGVSYRF